VGQQWRDNEMRVKRLLKVVEAGTVYWLSCHIGIMLGSQKWQLWCPAPSLRVMLRRWPSKHTSFLSYC